MKKTTLISMIAFLVLAPIRAHGGQNADSVQHHNSDGQKKSKKPTSISGKVGGDCKIFIADKDSKIWMVNNPEILSGIEERHVKVKAHVDACRGHIQIVSVHTIADERAGIKLDDAAFRR